MKKTMKKLFFWTLTLISALYTAFVAMCFWNWFVGRAFFHYSSDISYWNMVGIIMLVDLIWGRHFESRDMVDEMRWKIAYSVGETCIPKETKDVIKEIIESYLEPHYSELLFKFFGNIFGNTLLLILGLVVFFLSH